VEEKLGSKFSVDVSFICKNASATAGVMGGKISEMLCELIYFLLSLKTACLE
jgi:hypothetical protein